MPLPTSRELREMLDEATPGPWGVTQLNQQGVDYATTEFWISSEEPRFIATMEVMAEYHDQTERDFTLITLAPQLAEEVIRLREEIDMMADAYGPWHRWFAWRPVRTQQHGWRWLCTVERRQLTGPTFSPYDSPYLWFYRPTPNDRKDVTE